MKKIIRLTENDLHRIVKNSVKRVLKETSLYADDPYFADDYLRHDDRSEFYEPGKEGDMDYDWDCVTNPRAKNYQKERLNQDYDWRKQTKEWTPRELERASRQKARYLKGADTDDFDFVQHI